MGASYGSIHVRTQNSGAVQKALEEVAKDLGVKFLLGPAINGWISIFPDNAGQSDEPSIEIAKRLSDDIFHLILHDDDIFAYFFYRDGRLIDRYNSCPDYFKKASLEEEQSCQGRPDLFKDLFRKSESLEKLKALLALGHEKFIFEQERMAQFVKILGLSNALASYEDLQAGERDEIRQWKKFVHVPDLKPEKAAKRAAQALIKSEYEQLRKNGIFLAEIKGSKRNNYRAPSFLVWGTDAATNGLVVTSHSNPSIQPVTDVEDGNGLFSFCPPWGTTLHPLNLKISSAAHKFCTSTSASWFAVGFAFGDWTARVWDWRQKVLVFEVSHTQAVQHVSFGRGEHLLYSMSSNEFVVTSLATKCTVLSVQGFQGAITAAVHPSGKFAVISLQNELGIIDIEKAVLIKRLSVNRRIKSFLDQLPEETVFRLCLKPLLDNPKTRESLGVTPELNIAISQDFKAIEFLSAEAQHKIKSIVERVRSSPSMSFKTQERLSDLLFSPSGKQLFVAGEGMRVFNWEKLLSADRDAPAPDFSVDAPRDDENNPNSHPMAYTVRFDPERNILLSSCLAGVIQYLNLDSGQSGTLLKPPGELTIWQMEITSDGQALCCHCGNRPKLKCLNNKFNSIQVWNYPALCKAAKLD